MNKKKFNKVIYPLVVMILIFSVLSPVPSLSAKIKEEKDTDYILEIIEGIIHWKKSSSNIDFNDPLFNNDFLEAAGETSGDWYPIGMGRIGYEDDYDAYLAVIKDVVQDRYKEAHKLSKAKSTEWHRISLAVLASGGDPTVIRKDSNGQSINLIADGTYNRGNTRSLGAQGINGWIWGLITLDSMRYEVPDDAHDNREKMIKEIMKKQLTDGGFSLNSPTSDPDITAMAVQALAPYYNSEEEFKYEQKSLDKLVTKSVREVIDEALFTLSELQQDDGDYESMDTSNLESTAQVMVALTSLGIDPTKDDRFIKNGNTLLDGMLLYAEEDGGFVHSKTYDPENPTSIPDESNTMASEQALYALTSLVRFNDNYRSLYDFREEMNDEVKNKINTLEDSIQSIPAEVKQDDKDFITSLFKDYLNIPVEERSYVFNYHVLAKAMEQLKIQNTSEPLSQHMGVNKNGNGTITDVFNKEESSNQDTDMTEADEVLIQKILDQDASTENYVDVVRLLDKLDDTKNKEHYDQYKEELANEKIVIEDIEEEIESINKIILRQLYPFDKIRIKDKKIVEEVIKRYEILDEYDQEKIEGYDDVEKAETQIKNLIRARYIMITLGAVILGMSVLLVIRYKKRKNARRKEKMMDIE